MTDSLEGQNFKDFLSKLSSGEQHAWNTLNFVLKRSISHWLTYKFRGSVVTKDDLIQEVVQDTMATLFEKVTNAKELQLQFDSFKSLRAYAMGIAKHKSLDYVRRTNRMSTVSEMPEVTDREVFESTNPEEVFANTELLEKLLCEINDVEKTILLRFSQGHKMYNIAEELDLSPENCRIIKHRALKKLEIHVKKLIS